jgi:pre-mRNA-splicing factor ATP-dependent RNA helicase DHX16
MSSRTIDDYSSFVREQLLSVLGFAEKHTVDYVTALAKRASSAAALASALRDDAGVENAAQAQTLASALYARAPTTVSREAAAAAKRKADADAARRELQLNAAYRTLVDATDAMSAAGGGSGSGGGAGDANNKVDKAARKTKSSSRRKLANADESDESGSGSDGDDAQKRRRARSGKGGKGNRDDEEAEDSDAREKREIAEFEERLRERDKKKTKKLGENQGSKEAQETAARRAALAADADAARKYVPELRARARQAYLEKREPQQLKLLRQRIEDEEFLFKGIAMTAEERRQLELDKEVLRAAEQRVDVKARTAGYVIPDGEFDARGKLNKDAELDKLTARYSATSNDADTFVVDAEQKDWEAAQLARTKQQYGSRDRPAAAAADAADKYDFVFDTQIDFVRDLAMQLPGDDGEQKPKTAADVAREQVQTLAEVRRSLPIYVYRDELVQAVRDYQVLIIVGETGSGKTTQVAQYLHEEGFTRADGSKKIGCTQPRRVAAMSVAKRVADEMGVKLGNEVGYSIRFEDCTSDRTIIKFMTDGMLLREFLGEPDLSSYSVMIIDEAHERTLHTDILFGLVKDIARARPELKLVIASATLEAEKFSEYFDGAPIFNIPGRRYPVDIFYTKAPEADYLDAVVVTTLQVHITQPPGDILVFLCGQDEVDSTAEILQHRARTLGTKIKELIVARIYSTLPADLQAKIFEPTPPGARKVVLATNIAETSLTIDGIVYVIDPGFAKTKSFNPRSSMESLIVTPISRAAAKQRAGRAGRTSKGMCLARGTPILMDDGTVKPVEQIGVGDVVMGDDGTPRHVVRLFAGRDRMAHVSTAAGERLFTCTSSHMLTLRVADDAPLRTVRFCAASGTFGVQWFAVDALGIATRIDERCASGFSSHAAALAHAAADACALSPRRVIDMSVDNFLRLSGAARRLLRGFAAPPLEFRRASKGALLVDPYQFAQHVVNGGGGAARLPLAYKTADAKTRARLLAGVADACQARRRGGALEFRLAGERLVADVLFVARSLGLSASVQAKRSLVRIGGAAPGFEVCVQRAADDAYFGFELDGNQRFVLGDSFVVTHNCFRLYTAWAYAHELAESNIPEIQRTNLGNTVLLLKSLGINDLINFDFLDAPPAESLIRALEELYALGALNDRGQLTKVGRKMSEFPLDPKMSRALIGSEKYGCTEEVLIIMSMLSCGGSLWYAPQDKKMLAETARESFNRPGGDHLSLLNLYTQWRDTNYSMQWTIEHYCQHRSLKRARDIYDQILNLLERTEIALTSTGGDSVAIRKAIAGGYFQNVARLGKGGTYTVAKSKANASIHPSSSLKNALPRVLIFDELVFTTKEYMRNCFEIESKYLIEVAPHMFKSTATD